LRVFQRTLTQFGLSRPIWVGESNVVPYDDPTAPTVKPLHATMDQQAAYILQSFALARAGGAERMSVYKMVDERAEGPGELYGLVRNDGSPRPAFTAYQTAVRYLSDASRAVYTWDGASDPPTEDQVTQLLRTNEHRTQWIWPTINRVTFERGPERISMVWNGSSKLATGRVPAIAKSAAVVDKFGRDVGELIARDGQYSVELEPSTNNTDWRDPSLLLVGGDPRILIEKVAPLPEAVEAPIQVLWRRDASGLNANITGVLLQPGSVQAAQAIRAAQIAQAAQAAEAARAAEAGEPEPPVPPVQPLQPVQPVPCRWSPTVRLYASVDGGPTILAGTGVKRMLTQEGLTYPIWDFNTVDIAAANQGKTIEFWLDVDGVGTRATRWVYTAEGEPPPEWQQTPTRSCSDTP
jgi:hypothetical protein